MDLTTSPAATGGSASSTRHPRDREARWPVSSFSNPLRPQQRQPMPPTSGFRQGLRRSSVVLAVVLAAGLSPGLITSASAAPEPAPACTDPTQPILEEASEGGHVAVGTTKTQKLHLNLYTEAGCDVTSATAIVRGPRVTRTVTLRVVDSNADTVHWRGALSISPRTLRNSDAGTWATTYRVAGAHTDSHAVTSFVGRRVRLTFNAGPEPVRNSRITYSGHAERASWSSRTYQDLGDRRVDVTRIFLDEEDHEVLAEPRTRADGTFRVTRPYAGPGYYVASVQKTKTTAYGASRRDRVTTPQATR